MDVSADDVIDTSHHDDVVINYEDDTCNVPPPLPPRRSKKPSLKKEEEKKPQHQPDCKKGSDAEKNAFTPRGNEDGLSQTLKPSLQNELRARMNQMRVAEKS